MRNVLSLTVLVSTLAIAITAQAGTYQVCTSQNNCSDSKINTHVLRDTGSDKDYTKTQYPIVFVHGINGYAEKDWKDKNNEYWPGVPKGVYAGGADVYVTTVAAFDSPVARGLQLLDRVDDIIAITGAKKVNLIAHSQGAQTARFVAAAKPSVVATVTSIAGTNKGTPVASLSNLGILVPGVNLIYAAIAVAFNYVYDATDHESYKQHLIKDLTMLSPLGAADFNRRYPQAVPKDCGHGEFKVNGVSYYSWGGTKTVKVMNVFFGHGVFRDNANDTIVPRCSTHLGQVIKDDYLLNHTGLVNRGTQETDGVVAIYRKHANFLKGQGY